MLKSPYRGTLKIAYRLQFIRLIKDQGTRSSLDGRGRWRDNVHIERLMRTVKYEDIYV